jgi:hypothetical protein
MGGIPCIACHFVVAVKFEEEDLQEVDMTYETICRDFDIPAAIGRS